jgi:hypothetical protein
MKKMVMTIHWRRIFTAAAAATVLWLLIVGAPVHTFLVLMMIVASSILAGALRVGGGRGTRSISDVIEDVDTEAPRRPY